MAATQANQVSCFFRHAPTWVAEAFTVKLSGFPDVGCARHRESISVSFTAAKTSARDFIDRLEGPYIGHREGRRGLLGLEGFSDRSTLFSGRLAAP